MISDDGNVWRVVEHTGDQVPMKISVQCRVVRFHTWRGVSAERCGDQVCQAGDGGGRGGRGL